MTCKVSQDNCCYDSRTTQAACNRICVLSRLVATPFVMPGSVGGRVIYSIAVRLPGRCGWLLRTLLSFLARCRAPKQLAGWCDSEASRFRAEESRTDTG